MATQSPPGGEKEWILRAVTEMVSGILEERDRRYQERFEAQQEALAKVEGATEKRFESVNEFRKALSDRDVLYMPRAEFSAQHASIVEKLDGHGREDNGLHEAINKRIDAVSQRVDKFEGTISGSRTTLVTIGGIAAFLVATITIGTFIFAGKSNNNTAPQVIYVPAPSGTQLPVTPPAQIPR